MNYWSQEQSDGKLRCSEMFVLLVELWNVSVGMVIRLWKAINTKYPGQAEAWAQS